MKSPSTYEETVPSGFVTIIIALFFLFAAIFIGMLVYQLTSGPIGTRPAPNWHYALMFLTFAGTGIFLFNMRCLRIRIDERGIRVAYGMIRQEYAWENIESAAHDDASVFRYGGWGIRFTRAEGYWRRGYTTIGAPRVVLTLRRGKFRQFAFSTDRPEEVLRVIGEYVRG